MSHLCLRNEQSAAAVVRAHARSTVDHFLTWWGRLGDVFRLKQCGFCDCWIFERLKVEKVSSLPQGTDISSINF